MISLWFTYLVLSTQFKIKHANESTYLCHNSKANKSSPLTTCADASTATDWRFEKKSNGTGLIFPVNDANVWDVANEWRVEVKVKHGKPNQLFSLVYLSPDKYVIVNREKCLNHESPNHHMRVCNYKDTQLYTISYNENEVNELTETSSLFKNLIPPQSPVDDSTVDKLQKMIEVNKEIAKHMAKTHSHITEKRHFHHHHHHHHSDASPPATRRYQENDQNMLDYINN